MFHDHCSIKSSLAYFTLSAASSLPFMNLFSLDTGSLYKNSSTMFILITMACNISPIIIFAIRSFYKRHYKFKYELITNFTLALATVSSACLVIFFNFFTQVAWMGVPYVFLVLLFILASFQSMSRILVIGFLGHLKRQAVSTFIIGQGEYQGIL